MALRVTPLVPVTRGPDGFHVVDRTSRTSMLVLTQNQYFDLARRFSVAERDAGVNVPGETPRGDWRTGTFSACGGVPNYTNGLLGRLRHGEILEERDAFKLGVMIPSGPFAGRVAAVDIPKADVIISGVNGLTLTPITPWPALLGIVSVADGVLTVDDGV